MNKICVMKSLTPALSHPMGEGETLPDFRVNHDCRWMSACGEMNEITQAVPSPVELYSVVIALFKTGEGQGEGEI